MDKYQKVMEHVKVTEEMRLRICSNVEKAVKSNPKKRSPIYFYRYFSIAASLAVILVSGYAAGSYLNMGMTQEEKQKEEAVYFHGIEEVESAAKLTERTGIDIEDILPLKEKSEAATYLAYSADLAEINYTLGGRLVSYRKSRGNEDNSGDYSEYAVVEKITISNTEVTIKGEDQLYYLATWSDGTYSYSIRNEGGTDMQWMTDIIKSIME